MITLPDGSKAIVRSAKPDWKPTAVDIETIMQFREALLALCPGCKRYRHRCVCDLLEADDERWRDTGEP